MLKKIGKIMVLGVCAVVGLSTQVMAAIDLTATQTAINTAVTDVTAGAVILLGFGASLFGIKKLVQFFGGR